MVHDSSSPSKGELRRSWDQGRGTFGLEVIELSTGKAGFVIRDDDGVEVGTTHFGSDRGLGFWG